MPTDYSKKGIVTRVAALESGSGILPTEILYTKTGWTGITTVGGALDALKDTKCPLPASPAALTDDLTAITHTDPGSADYALQDLTDTGGFGFASKDEGNTVLKVIANLQARVAHLESLLVTAGMATAHA